MTLIQEFACYLFSAILLKSCIRKCFIVIVYFIYLSSSKSNLCILKHKDVCQYLQLRIIIKGQKLLLLKACPFFFLLQITYLHSHCSLVVFFLLLCGNLCPLPSIVHNPVVSCIIHLMNANVKISSIRFRT